jgi:hypothetical protein
MAVLIAGKNFSDALLEELQALGATSSLRELARVACQRLDWISPRAGLP